MTDSKKLNIGTEMTDDELMEMTGGSTFYVECQKQLAFDSVTPVAKYGIKPVAKYGIQPIAKYGIQPVTKYGIAMPLYGINPY